MNFARCQDPISDGEQIVCVQCKSTYHGLCQNITRANLKKMPKSRRDVFVSLGCKHPFPSSQETEPNVTLQSISEEIRSLGTKLADYETKLTNNSTQSQQVLNTLSEMTQKYEKTLKENQDLKKKNQEYEDKIDSLENLEIRNVPESNGGDLVKMSNCQWSQTHWSINWTGEHTRWRHSSSPPRGHYE